jgi:thiol:disulfide interchange protein
MTITLNPTEGAHFKNGVIAGITKDKFVVDYNHPLAGQSIDVDLKIKKIIKPSSFGNNKVEWSEDYADALKLARTEHKPIILSLYADWCQWCMKMLGGTFEDPWIRFFRDDYVWVKINSDKEKSFYTEFQQDGFPLTVLIDTDGEVIKKLNGYKKADEMRRELLELLNREPKLHAAAAVKETLRQ